VAMEIIYGGTTVLLNDLKRFGVNTDFDNSFDPKVIASLVKPETKIVWLESPTNPTMQLIDIAETCKLVKAKNPLTIVVVDNTFLTPLFQRPLELGADISVYSCSKYLNGHADMFFGALSCNDEKLFHILQEGQEKYGAIPSPYDCYNLLRSLKTLPLRMKQHCSNGQKVAEFLESHPAILKISYPGELYDICGKYIF
jgi:cystathionine beta-lyase/cystathionine gamma-synthase